ncbi:MAG: 50S ribosomal protein L19 [Bacteroidetes bacterium ADurb.Bin041]|nr:MAG: 50S ribosomal protein L19 [Bacteroidetes bacterium ADurb.Bin041]
MTTFAASLKKTRIIDLAMSKNQILSYVEGLTPVTVMPDFKAGDTITVKYKIREGNKERIQNFAGVVLQRKGQGPTATFTVRKISNNIGVERIFPVSSPFIEEIVVNKRGVVRRARIFYLRGLRGKKARIREKRV